MPERLANRFNGERTLSEQIWKLGEHTTGLLIATPSDALMHEEVSLLSGLPSLYTAMQYGGDTQHTAMIRERLLSREQPLLPLEVLARETDELMPVFGRIAGAESDPQYEAAVHLASHALFTLYTLYGDPRTGVSNQIVGSLEKSEHGVRAFYHNAMEIIRELHDLQTHFDNLGNRISAADRLDGLVAELYTDIVYGNGRRSDSPEGFDELLSAQLLYDHACSLGYPHERAQRLMRIVLGTSFDETTKTQPGRVSNDLVVRGVTALDLHGLARAGEGIPSSQDITLENLMSGRYHFSRVLGRAACQKNVVLHTRQEGLDFVRAHYDMPVQGHPAAATLGKAYEYEMLGSAQFHESYRPPDGWTLADLQAQKENAEAIRQEAFALAA